MDGLYAYAPPVAHPRLLQNKQGREDEEGAAVKREAPTAAARGVLMSVVEKAQLSAAIAVFNKRMTDESVETWPVADLVRLSKSPHQNFSSRGRGWGGGWGTTSQTTTNKFSFFSSASSIINRAYTNTNTNTTTRALRNKTALFIFSRKVRRRLNAGRTFV